MKIKVIGAGCETCDKLYEHVREAVAETGCDAEVEKVGRSIGNCKARSHVGSFAHD